MAWIIECCTDDCPKTNGGNIADLLKSHLDARGWFVCGTCGGNGYIKKQFNLQEPGQVWNPFLRGAIRLGNAGSTYQPFVFLVSDSPHNPPQAAWFSYYKDTRPEGRLKMGYGPGGPPVLNITQVVGLVDTLRDMQLV